MSEVPLKFTIIAKCSVTKARVAKMVLSHHAVDTPVFMPVGTQGTLKGMTPKQLEEMDCQIMLGNAYHLGNRPVRGIVLLLFFHSHFLKTRDVEYLRKLVDCINSWTGTEACLR